MNKFNLIKIFVFSLVFAVLLYPGFEKLYLYRQTVEFEDLLMSPIGLLADGQTILSDQDRFTRYSQNYKSLDIVRGNDLSIGIKQEFNFHERWVNLTEEKERVFIEALQDLNDSYNLLLNNNYSLIVIGPPVTSGDLKYLLEKTNLNDLLVAEERGFCTLPLPSAEQKCNSCQFLLLVLLNKEICEKRKNDGALYYTTNFDKFCHFDKFFTEGYFKYFLAGYGLPVSECSSSGSLLDEYNYKVFRFKDFLKIVYLSIILFLFFNKERLFKNCD